MLLGGAEAVGTELGGLVDVGTRLVETPRVMSGEADTVENTSEDVDSVVVETVEGVFVELGIRDSETSRAGVAEVDIVAVVIVRSRSRPTSVDVTSSDSAVAASMGNNSETLSDIRCILFFVPTPSPQQSVEQSES